MRRVMSATNSTSAVTAACTARRRLIGGGGGSVSFSLPVRGIMTGSRSEPLGFVKYEVLDGRFVSWRVTPGTSCRVASGEFSTGESWRVTPGNEVLLPLLLTTLGPASC